MAKEYAKRFYASRAWERCRDGYIKSVYGLCEKCGAPGKIVHHVEHITPQTINDPEVTLNWDNLQLLCQDCHNRHHHGEEVTEEGLRFDEEGNLVRLGGT
jgi:5-methylcytosine-specific restriction endonuclease McrA